MQRLASPTRRELDKAHKKHKWLDIGVPSFRNLFFINKWRSLGWVVLAASSLPLHLFYNSAVFAQISAVDYSIFVVDPTFFTGTPYNVSNTYYESSRTPILQWLHNNTQSLTNLTTTECINNYAQQMQSSRGHVLAVTTPGPAGLNNSAYGYETSDPSEP